jgi:tetratricopeptide (TPR) repeat protein
MRKCLRAGNVRQRQQTATGEEHGSSELRMTQVLEIALITVIILQGTLVGRTSQITYGTSNELGPSLTLPEICKSTAERSQVLSGVLKEISVHPVFESLNALGLQFAKRKQYPCAIPAFEGALRLDPKPWETHYNLAMALIQTGDWTRAANELRTVIEQKPDYLPARNAMGLLLQSRGELDAAAEQFKAALRIDSHSPISAFNLAGAFQSQKKYAAQVYYLRQTLASNPPKEVQFRSRLALAAALDQTGNPDVAVEELRKLVAEFHDSAEAHDALGNACGQRFLYKEARGQYEQALRIDPNNNSARLSLAKTLLKMGEAAVAIPSVQDYISRVPSDYEGYLVLGEAYRWQGDFAKAEEQLWHAVKLKPENYDARYTLGMVLARTGRTDEAKTELEEAKKLNPYAEGAHYELSHIYARMKDIRRAKEEADAFQLDRDRNGEALTIDLLRIKGDDFLRKGNAQDAANTYREAIKINPVDPGMHYNLALALTKLGDQTGEKQELERAVELGPKVAEAHNRLGTIYLAEGKIREAQKEFESAIALNPTLVEAMNNLGTLYGRMDDNQAAIQLFREAVWVQPQFAPGHANLGLALAADGKLKEAERELNEAVRLDPQNRSALTGLRMLKAREERPSVSYHGPRNRDN